MQEKLNSGEELTRGEKKILVHNLAHHMAAIRDWSRGTCNFYAQFLVEKYPSSFAVRGADKNIISDGKSIFFTALYERLNFIKPPEEKTKKRRTINEENSCVTPDGRKTWEHKMNKVYDSYGCAAWQPDVTGVADEEVVDLMFAVQSEDTERIKMLMEKTYPLQRKWLNQRTGELKIVLDKWPLLRVSEHFYSHVSILLGKNVKEVWTNVLESKGKTLLTLLHIKSLVKKRTVRNENHIDAVKYMRGLAESTAQRSNTDIPIFIGIFPSLLHYFEEEIEEVIHVIDVGF